MACARASSTIDSNRSTRRRPRPSTLLAGAILASAASNVMATVLYEPFNYDATTSMRLDGLVPANNNGHGWQIAGTNAGTPYLVSAITAGNIPGPAGNVPATGNYLQFGSNIANGTGVGDRIDLGGFNSGTVYYSLQFRVDDLGNASSSNTFVAGFNNTPGSQTGTAGVVGARLVIRKDATDTNKTKFDIGTTTNVANTSSANYAPNYLTVGQTYFIVESYTINPATNDDVANIWVNPDPATFATGTVPTPDATFTGVTDLGAGAGGYRIASFLFRQNSGAAANMSADELRVDTTWAGVTAVEWVSNGDSSWSTTSNWSNSTGSNTTAPDAQGADVTFGANSSVFTLSVDSPRTVGAIRFNSPTSYTLNGPGPITFDTPTTGDLNTAADNTSVSYSGGAANPAQVIVSQGNHTIAAPVVLNRSTTLNLADSTSLTMTGNLTATGAAVTFGQAGTGTAHILPPSVTVADNATLRLASSLSTIKTNSLSVGSGAKLDVTTGKFVIDYSNGGSPDPARLNAVKTLIASGFNGSTSWTGAGITSSTAASVAADTTNLNKTAVGYAEASATGLSTFGGYSTDSDMILIRYTYAGDADLTGSVDTSDFMALAQNFNTSNAVWTMGDFNYDGVVNALDFNLLATNFGATPLSDPPLLGTVVPEPIGLSTVGLAVIAAARGRRSRVKNRLQ